MSWSSRLCDIFKKSLHTYVNVLKYGQDGRFVNFFMYVLMHMRVRSQSLAIVALNFVIYIDRQLK